MEMSRAKKAKMIGGNPLIKKMVTAKMEGAMKRPERPKQDLPDWTKPDYKPPYEMGSGLKDKNPTGQLKRKVIKRTGVTRPQTWGPDDVLIHKSK